HGVDKAGYLQAHHLDGELAGVFD
ncbi:MAG: hypothetical protein RL203_291, partial [Pseudomonadota bacterium]